MKRFIIAKNSVITAKLGTKLISAEDGKEYFIKKGTHLRIVDIMYTQTEALCGIDNTTRKYLVPYTFITDHCELVDIQAGKVIEFAFVLQNELKDNINFKTVAIAVLAINAVALIMDTLVKVIPWIMH